MAEIPVERKEGGGFPWWLIPLLLLLLLLPLLYFCNRGTVVDNTNANRTVVTTNANSSGNMRNTGNTAGAANTGNMGNGAAGMNGGNTAVVMNSNGGSMNDGMTNSGGAARSGSVIKDVNEFGSTTDKSTLVGRGFFVNGGVRVNRVLSDKVFTVKSGAQEMFVMLDDKLDSPGGKEGQIRMKPGQSVNLGGEFRTVPTGEVVQESKTGGLNKNEYAQMKGQNVYLHATSVEDAK